MQFPPINIKATHFELTPDLKLLVEQKLEPLGKFLPEGATDAKCDVELERITDKQSGPVNRAEVNLFVDGKLYRAEATEDQIEKAIDGMRDDIKREIRRAHKKHIDLIRKGGKRIKDMLRFGR